MVTRVPERRRSCFPGEKENVPPGLPPASLARADTGDKRTRPTHSEAVLGEGGVLSDTSRDGPSAPPLLRRGRLKMPDGLSCLLTSLRFLPHLARGADDSLRGLRGAKASVPEPGARQLRQLNPD